MFIAIKPSCKTTSAQADDLTPQTIHKTLLARKIQKPLFRSPLPLAVTRQDANKVMAMAGH